MRRLRNHLVGVDQGEVVLFSDYLDGGEMWTGEGQRIVRRRVEFDEAYSAASMVSVHLSMWDTDSNTNMRADVTADDVGPVGFDIVFATWGDTWWARVRVGWTAIGEGKDEDDWQLY